MQLFTSLFRMKRSLECFSLLQPRNIYFLGKTLTDECKLKQQAWDNKKFARFWWRNSSATWQQIGSHISSIRSIIQMNAYWLLIRREHFSFSWADRDVPTWISSTSLVSRAFKFILIPSLTHQPQSECSTRSSYESVGRGSRWILIRGAAISIESWEIFLGRQLEFPSIISLSSSLSRSLTLHDPLKQLNGQKQSETDNSWKCH